MKFCSLHPYFAAAYCSPACCASIPCPSLSLQVQCVYRLFPPVPIGPVPHSPSPIPPHCAGLDPGGGETRMNRLGSSTGLVRWGRVEFERAGPSRLIRRSYFRQFFSMARRVAAPLRSVSPGRIRSLARADRRGASKFQQSFPHRLCRAGAWRSSRAFRVSDGLGGAGGTGWDRGEWDGSRGAGGAGYEAGGGRPAGRRRIRSHPVGIPPLQGPRGGHSVVT
jgi:hypothetical protein